MIKVPPFGWASPPSWQLGDLPQVAASNSLTVNKSPRAYAEKHEATECS